MSSISTHHAPSFEESDPAILHAREALDEALRFSGTSLVEQERRLSELMQICQHEPKQWPYFRPRKSLPLGVWVLYPRKALEEYILGIHRRMLERRMVQHRAQRAQNPELLDRNPLPAASRNQVTRAISEVIYEHNAEEAEMLYRHASLCIALKRVVQACVVQAMHSWSILKAGVLHYCGATNTDAKSMADLRQAYTEKIRAIHKEAQDAEIQAQKEKDTALAHLDLNQTFTLAETSDFPPNFDESAFKQHFQAVGAQMKSMISSECMDAKKIPWLHISTALVLTQDEALMLHMRHLYEKNYAEDPALVSYYLDLFDSYLEKGKGYFRYITVKRIDASNHKGKYAELLSAQKNRTANNPAYNNDPASAEYMARLYEKYLELHYVKDLAGYFRITPYPTKTDSNAVYLWAVNFQKNYQSYALLKLLLETELESLFGRGVHEVHGHAVADSSTEYMWKRKFAAIAVEPNETLSYGEGKSLNMRHLVIRKANFEAKKSAGQH